MADLADNRLNKKIVDAATVAKEVDAIEAEIAELRAAYDQFFMGIERRPPALQHQALKRRLLKVKGAFVRQTAIRFRINMVQQKFTTYERLWQRTLMEIENGTYRRDVLKAKALKKKEQARPQVQELPSVDDFNQSLDEVLSELEVTSPPPMPAAASAAQAAAARPGTPGPTTAVARPAAAATRPLGTPAAAPGTPLRVTPGATPAAPRPVAAPSGGPQQLSDNKLRAVFDAYVTAKKRCQEDTSKLSYEQVAANLRKQVPELMKKSGAASVEFKIVIKDGKAVLRAIPK